MATGDQAGVEHGVDGGELAGTSKFSAEFQECVCNKAEAMMAGGVRDVDSLRDAFQVMDDTEILPPNTNPYKASDPSPNALGDCKVLINWLNEKRKTSSDCFLRCPPESCIQTWLCS